MAKMAYITCYEKLYDFLTNQTKVIRLSLSGHGYIQIYSGYLGQWKPPIGKYLGDLADELACQHIGCPGCSMGHWIVEFVSCSAKNYAYKLNIG